MIRQDLFGVQLISAGMISIASPMMPYVATENMGAFGSLVNGDYDVR